MTIRYNNKIAETAPNDVWIDKTVKAVCAAKRERIEQAVLSALSTLSADDQHIVRRCYFDGVSLSQIAGERGVSVESLTARHKRALLRLRRLLRSFVELEYGVSKQNAKCVICSSPHRTEIDRILDRHIDGERYREEMRDIKRRFGVAIVSVMTIIGHRKYH